MKKMCALRLNLAGALPAIGGVAAPAGCGGDAGGLLAQLVAGTAEPLSDRAQAFAVLLPQTQSAGVWSVDVDEPRWPVGRFLARELVKHLECLRRFAQLSGSAERPPEVGTSHAAGVAQPDQQPGQFDFLGRRLRARPAGSFVGSASRSSTTASTPCRASSVASQTPVGPAPTIATSIMHHSHFHV